MMTHLGALAALALAAAGAAQAAPASTTVDQLMIQDLMARYEWALDSADAKGYAVRATIQKEFETLSQTFAASFPSGTPPKIQHILSNLVVEQHGDTAEARSFWTETWNPTGKAMGIRAAGQARRQMVVRPARDLQRLPPDAGAHPTLTPANPLPQGERVTRSPSWTDYWSNMMTLRAISPRFISSKASLTCSSLMRREIISSSFSCPDM